MQATAKTADEVFSKAIRLAELLGVPVVNGFSGLPAGSPTDSMPNWVTCPWPPHFLEILDYQWNDVAIPYWEKMGRFAANHGVKVAFEMHPGMLVYNVETMLRLRDGRRRRSGLQLRSQPSVLERGRSRGGDP